MKKILFIALSTTLFMSACEDPAANKTKATVNDPTSNSAMNATANAPSSNTAANVPANGIGLPITTENSKVEFTGSKVTGKHDGGFKQISGNIDLLNNKPEESKVSVEMDMNSIFTDSEDLTKHLKTADFFDVEKFPKASFVSTKIVSDAAKGADNYTVTGDFELHGTKKSITFPATIKVSDSQTLSSTVNLRSTAKILASFTPEKPTI